MAFLGKISPRKRIACPYCSSLLPDFTVEEILSTEELRCPQCHKKVSLPQEVIERAKQSRYLGHNLDITC